MPHPRPFLPLNPHQPSPLGRREGQALRREFLTDGIETSPPLLSTLGTPEFPDTIIFGLGFGVGGGWNGVDYATIATMVIEPGFMYMPYETELLIHTAAPPLLGPRYTRYNQPAAKRMPVRLMQPKRGERHPHFRGYETGEPSTVAVNVYSKGHLSATVQPRVRKPFAGNPIELAVNVNDLAVGEVQFARVTGRLIAPNYSLGNILLDFETIPQSKRKKYRTRDDNDESTFDLLAYLADYEKAKPGAFDLRDEAIEFVPGRDGAWRAVIKETPFPGVYRIGVQVEGSIVRADGCTERHWRVLNTEVALGIDVNADRTKPTLDWVEPNKLVVRFKPSDKLGNLAMPGSTASVQLLLGRRPIAFVQKEPDDGTIELEATAQGRGVKIDRSGRFFEKDAVFETPEGGKIEIKAKTPLKFSVRMGASLMAVRASKA